jgi:hypothetical protein
MGIERRGLKASEMMSSENGSSSEDISLDIMSGARRPLTEYIQTSIKRE